MRIYLAVVLALCVLCLNCGSTPAARTISSLTAQNSTTTTTFTAQTANNSSAANNFPTQSDGNLGANNVSKVNLHSLLYSGSSTKILAQLLVWFGQSNHMNVGYSSSDPAQVKRQAEDMISRGIDGVIIDWYGPNNTIDQATKLWMKEAEKHPGFAFAIMVDAGAIGAGSCPGCSAQETLTHLLQYVEQTYFVSPAYLNLDGQPIVTDFNVDRSYSVNWRAVNAALSTPPRYLFQDNDGFTHTLSDGSYSWVMPWASDYGLTYLSSFYQTGMQYSNLETVGATYKGFNDSLASWGSGRYIDQQCGQTWLQTFSQINSLYNSGRQLPYLQLVTWNDYEEGTEIESGIDSCFSLNASISGNSLRWTINGNESTVDHYNVYASSDGKNLEQVTHVKPGVHSVNLCNVPVIGASQLYVQAVGKPSLANRMPAPVSYSPSCH
ncbi:MAG TPA: endo-1,3-alpha-glucanase family glycosylhydrolase [Candidatus Sulfotelmatobacter sp.]|nr:endo-1,3-alpha-glucanase family glycosylhydrolase [Candidatus Sulfotelmatobacter sp.]